MRYAAVILMLLLLPITILAGTNERLVLEPSNQGIPNIVKMSSGMGETSLGFRLSGITLDENSATDGIVYREVNVISDSPEKFGQTEEEGQPELPVYSQLIAIPDMAGVQLEIIAADFQVVENVDVMPCQPSPIEGETDENIPFTKDNDAYQKDEFYPAEPVIIGEPAICRDLRFIQTIINPVQYNPVRRELRVYTRIDYRLNYTGEDNRNQKIRRHNYISETFLPLYRSMVPNVDEMLASYQPIRGGYLFITPDAFIDSVRVIARWKHLKGYRVAIARATDVNPSGSPSSTDVFNYIQNAYNTWEIPPEFVCIVGDINVQIPDYPYGGYNSDHKYSCVDGTDYFSDVFVTRMSVPNSLIVLGHAMRKALHYDRQPYMGDTSYWLRGLSVAGNIYAVTPRLTTLWVRQMLMEHGYTRVDTVFGWNGYDPGSTPINNSLNLGVSIVSYRGWAGPTGWASPGYDQSNINNLTHGWKMAVMASLVCGTGNFGYDECFGETWIRAWRSGVPAGGPCFYGVTDGSTHTKWNNPIMIGYYWAILEEGINNFAAAAFRGKLELYATYPNHTGPGSWVEKYFNTYNTLGEPELEVRTAIPRAMVATYPSTLPVGSSMATIHIETGGLPLQNAYVNLVKGYGPNEEVFVGGRTDASGNITLNFATTVADTMFITTTCRDGIPVLGTILIENQPVAVNINSITLDDDNNGNSHGNNDGNANPGESLEFTVSLKNFGNSTTATNVSATLNSTDSRIVITTPTQSYPDLAPGAIGNSPGKFAANLSGNIPQGEHIILQLNITSDQGSWAAALPVDIKSMMFAVSGVSYPGNPNNRLDPTETSQLVITLQNLGELAGLALNGLLSTSDTAVTITDNNAQFGDIGIDSSGSNGTSPFMVQVRDNVYHGHNVNFDLQLTSSGGAVTTKTFSAVIGSVNTFDPIGPDDHGYYLYDNTDAGYSPVPTYEWAEISPYESGSGTRIIFPLSTDDDAVVVSLPFSFVYYGQSFNYMLVSINGYVAFDTTRFDMQGHHWSNFDNNQIPEMGAPDGLIAPFWDDLKFNDNNGNYGVFKYNDTVNHRFIIEWKACYHPQAPGNHPETFQMIINDTAYYPTPTGDCEILFQYQTVYNDDTDTWDPEAPGLYCTVGMQNFTNDDGLQYTYDNTYHPAAAVLSAGRAIKITTATGIAPPPDIAYDPPSFYKQAQVGQILTDTLNISNQGQGSLVFSLNPIADNRSLSQGNYDHVQNLPEPIGRYTPANAKPMDIDQPVYPPSILDQGGPDAYGNRWIDSDEPSGPVYNWVDISSQGTPVTLGDDNYAGPFNIGFTFPFYDNMFTTLFINSNGLITFMEGTGVYTNPNIPSNSAPNSLIAMLWDDLNPGTGGSVKYYYDAANSRFIVSYMAVPFYGQSGSSLTFEVILYPTGGIDVEYNNLVVGGGSLSSNTVGIENSTGLDGLQVSYNNSYLHNALALTFFPPHHWLFCNVRSGILQAGRDTLAVITFDATDIDEGIYTGHLDLDSNDPDESSIDIPITFAVGSQGAPDISYSPASLTDTLNEGQTDVHSLIIRNGGSANLFLNLAAIEFNILGGDGNFVKPASSKGRGGDSQLPADIQNTWLFISPSADTLAPGDSIIAQITLDARFVGSAIYNGQIRLSSNDPDTPNGTVPVTLDVRTSGPNCQYVVGDVNGNGSFNGIDVTYGVSYFKGGNVPPYSCECTPGNTWYVAGDVNANCTFNGIDITYMVGYFKGGAAPIPCPNCPPAIMGSGNGWLEPQHPYLNPPDKERFDIKN